MPPPPGQNQLEAPVQSCGGRMKAHNADQAGGPESRQPFSFLHLFAGVERKADISGYLHALAARSMAWKHPQRVGPRFVDQDFQQELMEQVSAGRFSALLVSPPCNTWSRAVWANTLGPRPIRNSLHPLGCPWLSHANKEKADNCQHAGLLHSRREMRHFSHSVSAH